MGYTVEPEGETIAVKDCADGEPARKIPDEKDDPFAPCAVCSCGCVLLPGKEDTVFAGESGTLRMEWVCSSMCFEPGRQVEWLPVFHIREFEDHEEKLI